MSAMQAFAAAGYAPIPIRDGRPAVGGVHSGDWRYLPGAEARFPDCDIGLMCAARPRAGASGAGSLGGVQSTWVAAIRWESHNKVVAQEIDTIVSKHLGAGPSYVEGNTVTRIFRTEESFSVPRLPPMYFGAEPYTSLAFVPHRFEILNFGSWVALARGGKWLGGSLPEIPRTALPLLTKETAELVGAEVERSLNARGALSWR